MIADEKLDKACSELTEMGMSRLTRETVPGSSLFYRTEGDFESKGRFFQLNETVDVGQIQRLALYPSSFCPFLESELTSESRQNVVADSKSSILVPKPSAVYASMLRVMAVYPEYCVERTVLCSELSELINHHLYGLDESTLDTEEEDFDNKYNMERRVMDAERTVRAWARNKEWRLEEDWIGEVMEDLVGGCAIYEALP